MGADQLAPFADAEQVLRKLLRANVDSSVAVVSATGPEIVMPLVAVKRVGGDCDRITDFPAMLVETLAATRPASNVLAAQVQAIILNAVNTSVTLDNGSVALIDGAVVMVADHPEQYENPDVRQVSATFELRLRRPRLPA
jgi:hypothetical protein